MGYNINMDTKIKRVLFDSGVEYYIKGIFVYAIYDVPWYLMGRGVNNVLAFSIFFVLVLILSFILFIIEKKQKLMENKH